MSFPNIRKKEQFIDFQDNFFLRNAEETCTRAINDSNNLSEAFQNCEGLFPTYAAYLFSLIDEKKFQFLLNNVGKVSKVTPQSSFLWSQWIFSNESIEFIKKITSSSDASILLIGTPSLNNLYKNSRLVDARSSSHGSYLPQGIYEFYLSKPKERYQKVILDPPWNISSYKNWIRISLSVLDSEGRAYFPLLGGLTRPNADEDRLEILSTLEELGYNYKLHNKVISYEVPSFEASILNRNNIPSVVWKVADLVEVWKANSTLSANHLTLIDGIKKRREIESMIIRNILVEGMQFSPKKKGTLLSIHKDGPVMKSPSSREEGNKDCNVFTSNGYRFLSSDVAAFFDCLSKDPNLENVDLDIESEAREYFLEAISI